METWGLLLFLMITWLIYGIGRAIDKITEQNKKKDEEDKNV